MRIGSDPTDEELASMTPAELDAWADTQAIGPWTPNDDATPVDPITARLTLPLSRDLVAELEAEAALRRRPAPQYARDLLLLALRQVQAARGAPRVPPAGAAAAAHPQSGRPVPVPLTAEALRLRYANRVHRFAAMVARSPRGAEDLWRRLLADAIRALPTYDTARGDVEAWLWRVVAASARRWPRARWPIRRRTPVDSADALLTAVRALPVRERAAVALRYGADIDLRTAGAALGIPEAAARTLAERGLRRLPGWPADTERRLRALELGPPR
ncbi:MAG TPA: sigma-70 family RNA polymerase sigma factor [Candidatus Dormibacteraeota bacterium]|nr:sigma-70 family RNA polymerase sigma factor [Candidatus Dormibacteraeota bacterium]